MARCLVQFDTNQEANLNWKMFITDFSDQLEDYYQGKSKDYPDISLLVQEISNDILPDFFNDDYNIDDVLETVSNDYNAIAIATSFSNLLLLRAKLDLKANKPPYAVYGFDLVAEIKNFLKAKLTGIQSNIEEKNDKKQELNDNKDLTPIADYLTRVHQRTYRNIQAYRTDRFKNSVTVEAMTVSKFINEVFIKNTFIDVDNKVLVSQLQEPGEPSEIDINLKNYRKGLLKDLVARLELTDSDNKPLIYSDSLLTYNSFNATLDKISDVVMRVKYKNDRVSLDTPGVLFDISEDYKKTNSPELKTILDNFVDYVILSDFNKLFDYYTAGSLSINRYADDFDSSLRKYALENALSVDAINAAWDEKIQNGIDLAAPLYKTIINNTPILSFTTGRDTGEMLYPTLVAETFAYYFDDIDRYNTVNSIRSIIMDTLNSPSVPRTDKNVMYTIYKKFFELEGDNLKLSSKNNNLKVRSFHNTIRDNSDQSLLLLITKPISEISKVNYVEAVENPDGTVGLNHANVNSKTSVTFTISRFIEDNLNKSEEDLEEFIKNYNIKFDHAKDIVKYTSPHNGVEYELKANNNKVYDVATIKDLSRDLLGIDFNNDKRYKEFYEELQFLAPDGEEIATEYLNYLKDAFNILEAKAQLYKPKMKQLLLEGANDRSNVLTNYEVINKAIKSDRYFNLAFPEDYKFKLNTRNAKRINDLIYTAVNRFTGNRLKSTIRTVENTTVAGFSNYNYFFGLKQNFAANRRSINSAKRDTDSKKEVLSENIFMQDANLLKDFFIRGAAKVGDVVKGNSSQNDLETVIFNVNLGYFGRIKQALDANVAPEPVFDITVYSDKSNNPLPIINNEVTINGQRSKLFVSDSGLAVPETETLKLLYNSSGHYYRGYAQNIIDTWAAIYEAADQTEIFQNAISDKKHLSDKLRALNDLNQGDGKTNFWNTGSFDNGLKGYAAARYYAAKAGVALNNWVHFQNNTKSINESKIQLVTKPALIDNIALYDQVTAVSAPFKNKLDKQLINFANELKGIGFKFDANAISVIKRLYPDVDKSGMFGLEDTFITANNKAKVTSTKDIHPALRKMFYDYNLIQDNLMLASLGPIYAHKGDNENKMWIAQIKRNVAATASVRNYTLGLEQGVEDETTVAFVDDLASYSKTILGDVHEVIDYDGAGFETMTQRLKTQNSLNAKFNGDGGEVHKSFISHFNPHTGDFAETKWAGFGLTYDVIRQSIGSNLDLMELHKDLYRADISKVDITKAWKNGVNLEDFSNTYYYKREIDFNTGLMGTLFRLDSIKYLRKDENGNSVYQITTRNMSSDPNTPLVEEKGLSTFFDLWQTLGGIDSVNVTDEKTNMFYMDGNRKIYVTPSITSAQKLLDYESYIGNPGETFLPESYIDGGRSSVVKGYKVFNKLFDTKGIVSSQIQLVLDIINNTDITDADLTALDIILQGHDNKLTTDDFVKTILDNKDELQDLFNEVIQSNEDGIITFKNLTRPYQRFKGKNVDRIAFAGAQKVGQFNLNNIETVKLDDRQRWMDANPSKNTQELTFEKLTSPVNIKARFPKDQVKADYATKMIGFGEVGSSTYKYAVAFGNNANTGKYDNTDTVFISVNGRGRANLDQNLSLTKAEIDKAIAAGVKGFVADNEKVAKSAHNKVGEGVIRDYLLSKGLNYTVKDNVGFYTLPVSESTIPKIPGINTLITHGISNLNAGIQLNAYHETENAMVTTPTQMLNALIFNAKKLNKVSQMYAAIGNIVDKELTYVLDRNNVNIPELVKGMSNDNYYTQNKDLLLRIFKEIMEVKVAKDDEFTLESVIVDMFSHQDLPIDDPQIFSSAVAELTNYFTKTGIRTKFDGMFAILAPASQILQLHDVQYGFLPIKNENGGYDVRPLQAGEIITLQRAEYQEYLRLNEHLLNDPNPEVVEWAKAATTLNEKPRNLKGQQVRILHSDGTTQDLSILNSGEDHMIPEAIALDVAKSKTGDAKEYLRDKAYTKLDIEAKITALDSKYDEFTENLISFIVSNTSKDPQVRAKSKIMLDVLKDFSADLSTTLGEEKLIALIGEKNIFKVVYEQFSHSKTRRDAKMNKLPKNSKEMLVAKEHEYIDKLNVINNLFLGQLQKFLDEAEKGSIPTSLINAGIAREGSKLIVTRAECIAPITAKKAFLLRDGDNINDVNEHMFITRLNEGLDYLDIDADVVLLSPSEKKIFLHKGVPKNSLKILPEHENVREYKGKKWFTNKSGDRLFQIPDGMLVTNVNGNLHVYLNNKHQLTNNDLIDNLNKGIGKGRNNKFDILTLGDAENRKFLKQSYEAKNVEQAKKMYASWQLYINKLIGTRVPGQHFQSFQGMKIVGFSTSNNIHVANEVILLSGADYDIDKQNIIYHSISGDGVMELWHPAARHSTVEDLEQSLKLPMPSGKTRADFEVEKDSLGGHLDKYLDYSDFADTDDFTDPNVLLPIYEKLDQGYKIDPLIHPTLLEALIAYDNPETIDITTLQNPNVVALIENFDGVSINAVKNFAVSNTNQIIESPSNFIYLSNGVTTDTIKQFSSRTPKAEIASGTRKENPHSQSVQKEANMVGKQDIGIMASPGLKVLSAVTYATNNTLKEISMLYDKALTIDARLAIYGKHLETVTSNPNDIMYTAAQLTAVIDELTAKRIELRNEIDYLKQAIGGSSLTLPNINYDLLSPEAARDLFKSIHRLDNGKLLVTRDNIQQLIKIVSRFDPDLADLESQLLSSATDNAKELDLGKINGLPSLLTIYPSMGLNNEPFEHMIDVMTSPLVEMFIRNATKNIYDRTTSRNGIADLVNTTKAAFDDKPSDAKTAAILKLETNYKLLVNGDNLVDIGTKEIFKPSAIIDFNTMYYAPAQLSTLLAKYLGINQGIPSNSWDLYTFATKIQDVVNNMLIKAEIPPVFDFKMFLDSLSTNGEYHKNMIKKTSNLFSLANVNFNPLYVLSINPHFAKQLTAFNASNTILKESSYRVSAMYNFVSKLRKIGYLRQTQNINKKDFEETEKFIEATVIESFITNESRNNYDNLDERPIFYNGNSMIDLKKPEDRNKFVEWVQTEFLKNLRLLDTVKGNAFIQDLSIDSKNDSLLFDKVDFMKLQMDTTNVKSNTEQGHYRDAYIYGLKDVYKNKLTDLQSSDPRKNNNIFNVLFWYNLIVNKNNITKNSYAKLLGDVMWQDNRDTNVYSRLLLLKGTIGKSDEVDLKLNRSPDSSDFYQLSIGGINFDLLDLFVYYEVGNLDIKPPLRPDSDDDYDIDGDIPFDADDDIDYTDDDQTEDDTSDDSGDSDTEDFDALFEDEEESEESNKLKVLRIKQKGVEGTRVQINFNEEPTRHYTVTQSSLTLPSSNRRNAYVNTIGYNPFKPVVTKDAITDNFNYYKMAISNVHTLLANLSDGIEVEIVINGKTEKFNKNKDYKC